MTFARVEHDDRDAVDKGNPAVLERTAVQQQRMACAPQQRRSLIENSRRDAERTLFGAPACPCQLERLDVEAGSCGDCERDSDRERP